ESLGPIARGSPNEVELIESALADPSPAVQRAALAVAAAAARRRDGVYQQTLAQALTSSDAELRRLAFSAASALGDTRAGVLYQSALGKSPEPGARRELLAAVATTDSTATPSAVAATSILSNRDLPASTREKARNQLRRGFSTDAKGTSLAAAKLASDGRAPAEERVLALQLLREFVPEDSYAAIADDVKEALDSAAEPIKAAALPLYGRVAPSDAARILAAMLEQREATSVGLRVAMALAWGELAKTGEKAAPVALEALIDDDVPAVRAAAAEAYGNVGRPAQNRLIKMVREERLDVAIGASQGLANSAAAGASGSVAVGGIVQLWRRKGRPRRAAARVFARIARTNPGAVYSYLTSAARSSEDAGLHVIGATGLCNGSAAGHRKSRRTLAGAVNNDSVEVRRIVIQCTVDHPGDTKNATFIASRLAGDIDSEIRADAARVLNRLVEDDVTAPAVLTALLRLARDPERDVRLRAVRALARLGKSAPEDAGKVLLQAFERADEG
ncbi:MAG: hypothetical protein AAGC55_26145, partial [Myxococcota bacterium]